MTDTERERINAICEVAGVAEIDDLSDGFHTFRQLYYQRMMLFAVIAKQNKDRAWKSLRHEDGELCFGGGWFIVGIDTPEGSYTYHYENKYFDLFDCEILDYGKHWDGHTEKDVTRLLSLQDVPDTNVGDLISRQAAIDAVGDWIYNPEDLRYHKDVINSIPAVQPEIVRCKDCKHWDAEWSVSESGAHYCPMVDGNRNSDFYCADAERRIDDKTNKGSSC
jgi:hypothetical protein